MCDYMGTREHYNMYMEKYGVCGGNIEVVAMDV
jgi:hypothetical protein